jgi:hypothetical protein
MRTWVEATERFPDVMAAGRVRALKAVPIVMHLNYIGAKHGAYEAYPELAGKGDEAVPTIWYEPRRIRVPCGACPALKKIIADYMADLASKRATEVSVWLSEFWGQCQCDECVEAGQLRMETRAAYEGWIEARKQHPNLVMRVFYCMGGKSLEDTYNVLMELPPEVKIERCYGRYGQAFDKAAAEGRWLASWAGPPLSRAEYSGLCFHGASQTRDYIRRLRDKKWAGVYSINYVYSNGTYQRGLFDFQVHALAEWTWNSNGRDLKQLAKAWAVRSGYAQPEKVAEWTAIMDPIERTLHYVLTTRNWGKLPEAGKSGEKLQLGLGLLAGFPNATALDEQTAACKQALSIAQDAGAQDLALETQYVAALVRSIQSLDKILAATAEGKPTQSALADFRRATQDMIEAFDAKIDLLDAEPKSFAESTKKLHADMWQARANDVAAACSSRK